MELSTRDKIIAARKSNPILRGSEIAAQFGVSRQRVNQILSAEGLAGRIKRPPPINVTRKEYQCWWNMLARCYNPKDEHYKWYGARGIQVCERWRTDFANFYEDMGPRPSSKHSIDRKKNDGNYEPRNCRWATATEQNNNTRRIRK